MKKIYKINANGKKAEVFIYEDIGEGWFGGLSAKRFADDIKALGKVDEIKVMINSNGGSVFEGVAIYNTLVKNQARIVVEIDGIAASIASVIAMAGDEVRMAENAFMMIHDPWIVTGGTADELRDTADTMDKVRDTLLNTYMKRSSAEEQTISEMMSAETWLTATEAHDIGLVDSISERVDMAAFAIHDFSTFKNAPKDLQETAKVIPIDRERRAKLAGMQQALRKYRL